MPCLRETRLRVACAHPPLTPKKSGRGRLCVAVVSRVSSHMTFTWICGKDADWLERAGATYEMAVPIRLLRLTSTGNRLWRNTCSVYLMFSAIWLRSLKMAGFRA